MNIKDINKYKFIVLDKKITNIYWKFLSKKNISIKKKIIFKKFIFCISNLFGVVFSKSKI